MNVRQASVTGPLGRRRRPGTAETAGEFAHRVEGETGLATLTPLSDLASAGTFGPEAPDDDQAAEARRLAGAASESISSEWNRSERFRWRLGLGPRRRRDR